MSGTSFKAPVVTAYVAAAQKKLGLQTADALRDYFRKTYEGPRQAWPRPLYRLEDPSCPVLIKFKLHALVAILKAEAFVETNSVRTAFIGCELHQPAAPRAAFLDCVFEHLSAKMVPRLERAVRTLSSWPRYIPVCDSPVMNVSSRQPSTTFDSSATISSWISSRLMVSKAST